MDYAVIHKGIIMKIKQLGSNQMLMCMSDIEILFSYETPVAGHSDKLGWFRTNKKYSVTTSRHINRYLNGNDVVTISSEEIEKLLK